MKDIKTGNRAGGLMRLRTKTGFTLAEILIAVLILIPVCVATIYVFIKCVELSELARHSSEAVREIKSKVTQIENTPFDQIKNTFHNVTFAPAGLNAMGVTYIDDTEPDMLTVTATLCWKEKNGRVMGEDKDLDGQLDSGEDANSNGMLDSPVTVVTRVSNF
jgi:Tfp pilus assembly protein PilV